MDSADVIFLRFSEPISHAFLPEDFSLRCGDQSIPAKRVVFGDAEPRDMRIILSASLRKTGQFCDMTLTRLSDIFGNATTVRMSLPLRYS